MPKVTEEIITEALKILKLCLKLKNVGVDAVFQWFPPDLIDVRVYENGYQRDSKSDKDFLVHLDKEVLFDKYHARKGLEGTLNELSDIKKYLTALLKKHSKSVHAI